jgi:putative PIN family toxin of toxin-antitoxin system
VLYAAEMPIAPSDPAAERRTTTPPLTLVLDTNIVLDWLVFRSALDLQRAVTERRVQLITHQPALEELRRVLTYPQCKLDPPAQEQVLQLYQSATTLAVLPIGFSIEHLMLPAGFPHCRDGDDEPFLALTYHARADALVTKDNAVLKLRKRALRFGVTILTPAQLAERLEQHPCQP